MAEDDEGTDGTEQGPAGLRKHNKELVADNAALRAQMERDAAELQGFRRERAFQGALAEAKVEGVTIADVGDLPADQITAALLKAKATEKEAQRRTQDELRAKDLGFDSLDEYLEVVKLAQEHKAKQTQERQTAASVATSAPGGPPPTKTAAERALETHAAAVAQGMPEDYAQAEFVRAMVTAAMEEASVPGAGGQT